MNLIPLLFLLLLQRSVSTSSRAKVVINTAWWPPGTENTSESVGILSYGDVYLTGMMENKNNTKEILNSELSDITDILHGANVTQTELVQCLINAPKNRSSEIKNQLETLLNVTVATSFVEIKGEYGGYFQNQMTCTAMSILNNPKRVRQFRSKTIELTTIWYPTDANHTSVRISMSSATSFDDSIEFLENKLKTNSAFLYDCTVYYVSDYPIPNLTDIAITSVRVEGLLPNIHSEWICSGGTTQKIVSHVESVVVVKGGPVVYVSGLESQSPDGSEAFEKLEKILSSDSSSSNMSLVTNCIFYVNTYDIMKDLFQGFYNTFNVKYFPPPSRTEFTLNGTATTFNVLVKCVAAAAAFY